MSQDAIIDLTNAANPTIPAQRAAARTDLKLVVPAPRRSDDDCRRIFCARVPISACTPDAAVAQVLDLARSDRTEGADVHLCNAYTLSLADQDSGYRFM
jgi:hypothetical protein